MPFKLLKCLAKAVAKNAVKFLCNFVPGGGVVYDIAADAWEDYRKDQREDVLRSEVQALAQASAREAQQAAEQAVQAEAATLPLHDQQALTAYLTQVRATIRRSLRRPSDPTGTTVPASMTLSGPE